MSSFDSDSSSSDDQLRPRLETYAGRELKPHRIRTNSNREMTRLQGIKSNLRHQSQSVQAVPMRIGAFTSTESVFSSYVPISNIDIRQAKRTANNTDQGAQKPISERDSETGEAVESLLPGDDNKVKEDNAQITITRANTQINYNDTEGFEAWQVLFACTCSCVLMGIDWVAFPVFYVHFAKEFETSQLTTGWVGSLQNAVSHVLGIVFSAPIQIYGCKPVSVIGSLIAFLGLAASSLATSISFLYMSFGIVAGIGLSMVSLPTYIIIQQHFTKNRSIATAISMCGVSVGQIIGPMLLETLVDWFGWRGAMLLFAGVTLHNLPMALLYCRAKHEQHKDNKGIKQTIKQMIDFSLLKDVCFTLFCVGFFLVKFNVLGYYQHLPARTVHLGHKSREAAILLTITGICSGTNRLLSGVIANLKCTNRILMYSTSVTLGGLATTILPLAGPFWLTSAICGLYGCCLGTMMLLVSIVLVDLLGVQNIARSRGLFNAFSGISGLLATPFSGYLFDVSDNYDLPFYVVGAMGIVGGVLSFIVFAVNKHRKYTEYGKKDKPESC